MPNSMLEKLLRKASLSFLLAVFMLSICPVKGFGLSYYQRGSKSKGHPHSPNRYNYVLPGYLHRQPQKVKKRECKPHGLSRCLGPKTPGFKSVYSRNHNNGVHVNTAHPLVRKTLPAKFLRVR